MDTREALMHPPVSYINITKAKGGYYLEVSREACARDRRIIVSTDEMVKYVAKTFNPPSR